MLGARARDVDRVAVGLQGRDRRGGERPADARRARDRGAPADDGARRCQVLDVGRPLEPTATPEITWSEALKLMSLLVALLWWISTASTLVPFTSAVGKNALVSKLVSPAPPTAEDAGVA